MHLPCRPYYFDYLENPLACSVIYTAVSIGFTRDEYESSESKRVITTTVGRTETRLAHPVSLRVQPMTIDEAVAMGLEIPLVEGYFNITENNTDLRRRIPIRAKGKQHLK